MTIVRMTGWIDDSLAVNTIAAILGANGPVQLVIDSLGGSTTAGLAIYDTMQLVRGGVSTMVVNKAMSMAAVLLCGGALGERFAGKDALIMVHEAQATNVNGDVERAQYLALQRARIRGIFLNRCGSFWIPDTFFDAQQAKDARIVDKVVVP